MNQNKYYHQREWITIDSRYSPYFADGYISINTRAPDFQPVKKEEIISLTYKSVGKESTLNSFHKNLDNGIIIEPIGDLIGIRFGNSTSFTYYYYNKLNYFNTKIMCRKMTIGLGYTCWHEFVVGNYTFFFGHTMDLIPRYKEMQNRLYDLFESFYDQNGTDAKPAL